MFVKSFADLPNESQFDFIIVGSGFGGSVSALRLSEKGYSVGVLEEGRHYQDEEFPKSHWSLHRWLWLPYLFMYGIQRMSLLRDVLVLSGAGIGGGSLVYANTLLEPGEPFYGSPECRQLAPDLKSRLLPHFRTARMMLGAAQAPQLSASDELLRSCALEMNRGETFHKADVGVFFGPPGEEKADPYFGGEGPRRKGCTFCGGCMIGCRHNAKNTLVKNYLPLAQRRGAQIFSRCKVERIQEITGGDKGFILTIKRSGYGSEKKSVMARRLVISAGVLGTMRLLLNPRNELSNLPKTIGRKVRTNSEVLLGSQSRSASVDYSKGLAIACGMWPDDRTHIETVRYPAGFDAMGLLGVRNSAYQSVWKRLVHLVWVSLTHPLDTLRLWWPFGWARRTPILLVMQTQESSIRLFLTKFLGLKRLNSRPESASSPLPKRIPIAEDVLDRFSRKMDGIPLSSAAGSLLNISTTAHIIGGAVMSRDPDGGATDIHGRVWGYQNLWIIDGSLIPANLGVNPSLTITALAEHAMDSIPTKTVKPL